MRFDTLIQKTPEKANPNPETKGAIYAAAKQLFYNNGYLKTSVREIAKEAGVSPALILYYYGSKEGLAKEIAYSETDAIWEIIGRQMADVQLAPGVKLFVYNRLIWYHMIENHGFAEFYSELLMDTCLVDEQSRLYKEMCEETIKAYRLALTEEKMKLYNLIMNGASRNYLIQRKNGTINISYEEFSDTVVCNYFFNIGLSDKQITEIIKNGLLVLNKSVE